MPVLYMVGTPIGNLKDITLRALETLKAVDAIVCEDTRHSLRLLNAYEITKPLISCHGYNEERAAQRVIAELGAGKDLAYVSDAGTPGISDPGSILVDLVVQAGFAVVPIPGPSALAAMVSVAGVPGKRVSFDGFLSPKSGRRKNQLKELLSSGDICVVYESPHRIVQLLRDLDAVEPECRVVLGRELTKIHEELLRGKPAAVREILEKRQSVKGEIALLINPPRKKAGRGGGGDGPEEWPDDRFAADPDEDAAPENPDEELA
jgi:16S rRNA (cytidine1402-2'-O)-methyltransferase